MSRKLTYEFVKESFESENCLLLSNEIVNAKTKLDYICSKGHEHSIDWKHWQRGHRCIVCYGKAIYTINKVRESFENYGYELLSKEYINSNGKLNYKCSKGHGHSICWSNWQQGNRCPTCAGQTKPTIEYVEELFKKEGYTLLSKKYINAQTKLYYQCSNNHEHSIIYNCWQRGIRCPTCAKKVKPTIGYVKECLEKENYILLSKEYVNSTTKLDYICSNNHNNNITWHGWNSGNRCSICRSIKFSGSGNPNWKGGLSYEPYCPIWSDKEYKQYIRDRDGNKCLNPYCSKNNSRLTIHHIDYNKKNCSPSNLITVCNSCNARANTDRDWHTTWYQALVYMRYNNK
jgi:hypothetical protein